MPPEGKVIIALITLTGGFCLLLPVVKALAERLRPRADAAVKDEVQALREDVIQELQQVRRDVAELEERVDFAERLLAKQREAERLAPPVSR